MKTPTHLSTFLLRLAMASACAFFTTGCSDSSNSSSGGAGGGNTDFTAGELGYNPRERWPEAGTYSYDYDFTFNGVNCQTKQSFGNKADYCMGLQDQTLNNDCALSVRKNDYKRACGTDFQEVNFRANFSVSGFDDRLQRRCETGRPASSTFRTSRQFCNFLKDETLHQSCHWDRRSEKFQSVPCGGEFSPPPSRATDPDPTPTPGPNPTPTPTPRPDPTPVPPNDPLDRIPVVQELRAEGFEVSANWEAIRQSYRFPRPGQPSVDEQMRIFWSELAANKQHLIRRKNAIREIEVTIYTNTRDNQGKVDLALDFEQKPGELGQYFPLFDQLQRYRNQLGIDFSFIQSGHYSNPVPYAPLRSVLVSIEKNWKDFVALDGVIKELRLDEYAGYFSLSQTLTLRRESIEADFTKYVVLLKPLAPLMAWAKVNRVKLNADFDLEDEREKVHTAFAIMTANIPNLTALTKAGMLKELTVYFDAGEVNYWGSLKNLSVSVAAVNRDEVSKLLTALSKIAKLSTEIHKPIELFDSDVDDGFLKSVSLLETVWTKILPKASKIKKISVGYESTYYPSLQELHIGSESTLRETEKVIAEIK